MSHRSIRSGDTEISFRVKRSRRRTVAMRVEPSGAVTVAAPPFVWGPFIDRFVRQHTAWILKKLAYFKERALHPGLFPVSVTEAQRAEIRRQTEARLLASVARGAER